MAEAARRVYREITVSPPDATPSAAAGGHLTIEAVRLTRPLSNVPVLDDLTLDVSPGETVALTGPSGSGKSTLLLSVAGLHPVASGMIAIGGLPVFDWDETSLRDTVALLPQRSVLMNGTVADALRLAAPDSDAATMWQVLEAVQLAEVMRANDGLNTVVGARGDRLSGGEGRRLVLARALLRRPKVLLLDEPTEGLDETTAQAVLAGVRRVLPDAAILIAAHRLVETRFADRTVSLI
jgi:ATP-binding cassette subfamily C protein CydC